MSGQFNPAFDHPLVVRAGDKEYPSLRSIALAAASLGVGIMTGVADDGSLAFVRVPQPKAIIDALLRLAATWDDAIERVEAIRAGREARARPPEAVQIAVYEESGKVCLSFGTAIDAVSLSPDEAERIGEGLVAYARDARENPETPTRKKVSDDGSGPIEA